MSIVAKLKEARNEEGSVMVEAALCFILLVMLVLISVEILSLIRLEIYSNRIAREGAREAALTGNISAGTSKARALSQQYLGGKAQVSINNDDNIVVCNVNCKTTVFKYIHSGEMNISAKAIYPWQDSLK